MTGHHTEYIEVIEGDKCTYVDLDRSDMASVEAALSLIEAAGMACAEIWAQNNQACVWRTGKQLTTGMTVESHLALWDGERMRYTCRSCGEYHEKRVFQRWSDREVVGLLCDDCAYEHYPDHCGLPVGCYCSRCILRP